MRRLFQYGGYFASAVLILFGAGSIVIGSLGFLEVRDTIARENITATPDAEEIGVDLEPGEEIDTDEFGRVKVQFHWDRYGKVDENSSCWVRVSQPVAGKGWGFISLPRRGQEVIVEFLEGDPDQPIITGRVYNATNKVPYTLGDNKTISAFKSNSSKGGQGFNEIQRGVPRISRALLAKRLRELAASGVIESADSGYRLTEAGLELGEVVKSLGTWGARWTAPASSCPRRRTTLCGTPAMRSSPRAELGIALAIASIAAGASTLNGGTSRSRATSSRSTKISRRTRISSSDRRRAPLMRMNSSGWNERSGGWSSASRRHSPSTIRVRPRASSSPVSSCISGMR